MAAVYDGLTSVEEQTYLENLMTLQKFWTKKEISRINDVPRILGDIDVMSFDSTLVRSTADCELNLKAKVITKIAEFHLNCDKPISGISETLAMVV